MPNVAFLGIDCQVGKMTYPKNKQPALQLYAADTSNNHNKGLQPGEPVMTATSCLVDYPFQEGETAIKNYSENEGILDVLVNSKIIELTGKFAYSGHYSFPVVKLLV